VGSPLRVVKVELGGGSQKPADEQGKKKIAPHRYS
jgi:hypothetical protein